MVLSQYEGVNHGGILGEFRVNHDDGAMLDNMWTTKFGSHPSNVHSWLGVARHVALLSVKPDPIFSVLCSSPQV
jgi:hypothetical protein